VSIFWTIFDLKKVGNCSFDSWKEEIKTHRIIYSKRRKKRFCIRQETAKGRIDFVLKTFGWKAEKEPSQKVL